MHKSNPNFVYFCVDADTKYCFAAVLEPTEPTREIVRWTAS